MQSWCTPRRCLCKPACAVVAYVVLTAILRSCRRNYAGMSLKQFKSLNPFALCGILPLFPGVPVCSGDKLSFCSNRFVTSGDDSCSSIADTVGSILALQAGSSCSDLGSDVDVCIAPAENAVRPPGLSDAVLPSLHLRCEIPLLEFAVRCMALHEWPCSINKHNVCIGWPLCAFSYHYPCCRSAPSTLSAASPSRQRCRTCLPPCPTTAPSPSPARCVATHRMHQTARIRVFCQERTQLMRAFMQTSSPRHLQTAQ